MKLIKAEDQVSRKRSSVRVGADLLAYELASQLPLTEAARETVQQELFKVFASRSKSMLTRVYLQDYLPAAQRKWQDI